MFITKTRKFTIIIISNNNPDNLNHNHKRNHLVVKCWQAEQVPSAFFTRLIVFSIKHLKISTMTTNYQLNTIIEFFKFSSIYQIYDIFL